APVGSTGRTASSRSPIHVTPSATSTALTAAATSTSATRRERSPVNRLTPVIRPPRSSAGPEDAQGDLARRDEAQRERQDCSGAVPRVPEAGREQRLRNAGLVEHLGELEHLVAEHVASRIG